MINTEIRTCIHTYVHMLHMHTVDVNKFGTARVQAQSLQLQSWAKEF